MQETEYKRLIDSAQERALAGFVALVQQAMQDADRSIVRGMALARSGAEQAALGALRHFLQQDGNLFLGHVDRLYRGYLARAMQTMYVDMRPGIRKLSIDELTLLDDEVLSHQIEVGRLTERMRESNEESIGRLNVIVAQLHGERGARERENPFRPYLLARALYEAVRKVAANDARSDLLFRHLSNAMIEHVPGYYSALRDLFESAGLQGKFVAQPSRHGPHQRYFGAPPAPSELPGRFDSRMAPGLQGLLGMLQQLASTPGDSAEMSDPARATAENAQELLRKMFESSRFLKVRADQAVSSAARRSAGGREGGYEGRRSVPSSPLLAQLAGFQRHAATGKMIDEHAPSNDNRLFSLRDKLDLGTASVTERVTVDVIAMLFEFILGDTQMPASLRGHIARLQIPVMKAAMLDSGLLHQEAHPARRLLNRISSAALSAGFGSDGSRKLDQEIERITQRVLLHYDSDTQLFADCLQEFEGFLRDQARHDRGEVSQAIEALELAERLSVLLINASELLRGWLPPLTADKHISEFVTNMWPQVLVQAARHDLEQGAPPGAADSLFEQCRLVLPELLWSTQDKRDVAERSALIRLLPALVKRMNRALQLIRLADDERREILDLLVTVHTRALRASPQGGAKKPLALEVLRQDFARLDIHWESMSWNLDEPPQAHADLIEEVFARYAVNAELHPDAGAVNPSATERELLSQTFLLGARVEFRSGENAPLPARLVWVSTHRSLYLFQRERDGALVVYGVGSLLDALGRGVVVPVEYAPAFERAVESLLFGAGKIGAP